MLENVVVVEESRNKKKEKEKIQQAAKRAAEYLPFAKTEAGTVGGGAFLPWKVLFAHDLSLIHMLAATTQSEVYFTMR